MAKISPIMAGEMIGQSAQWVRIMMQRDKIDIGVAEILDKQYTYYVQPHKLAEFLNVKESDVLEAKEYLEAYMKLYTSGKITRQEYNSFVLDVQKELERRDKNGTVPRMPLLQSPT